MRVIVLQIAGLDTINEAQIAKLQAATATGFVDAVKAIGIKTETKDVQVDILEGPFQKARTKRKTKSKPKPPAPKTER